jgi:hypothetical protein
MYSEAREASVLGLTDLFGVANRIAGSYQEAPLLPFGHPFRPATMGVRRYHAASRYTILPLFTQLSDIHNGIATREK